MGKRVLEKKTEEEDLLVQTLDYTTKAYDVMGIAMSKYIESPKIDPGVTCDA